MLRDKASSVQQLTKLRKAKERQRAAQKRSDKVKDTDEFSLIKYCTACGLPDCDFAPITEKVKKRGGKR